MYQYHHTSDIASHYEVAGYNLHLLIWLDSIGTVEYVHQKDTAQSTLPLGFKDFMHIVSNVHYLYVCLINNIYTYALNNYMDTSRGHSFL